jgi:hypothetical protein
MDLGSEARAELNTTTEPDGPRAEHPRRLRPWFVLVAALWALFFIAGCGTPTDPAGTDDPTPEVPEVAQVECTKHGIEILTPEVRPQSDGVHVHIENTSGGDASFFFELGGRDASGTQILPIPPGEEEIGCVLELEDAGKAKKDVLKVVDPEGLYVSDQADCPGGSVGGEGGYLPQGARGEKGDPVEMTRRQFADDLQPGDEVRHAGYPDAEEPSVAIVRGDRTVLVQKFFPDGPDRWFPDEYTACSDFLT